MQLHTYELCTLLYVSYTSIKKLIKGRRGEAARGREGLWSVEFRSLESKTNVPQAKQSVNRDTRLESPGSMCQLIWFLIDLHGNQMTILKNHAISCAY